MGSNRRLTKSEERLLQYLVKKASLTFPSNWEKDLVVQEMNDEGMGSLYLYPNGIMNKNRVFGECVSECQFIDKDGIDVIASLNLDQNGDLFELDIWKTDFSPLIELPEID